MKGYECGAVFAVLGCMLMMQPLQAQTLEEGHWSALMLTPGGELAEATYEIERVGESVRATMKWLAGEAAVTDIRLENDLLSYSWNPGFQMDCRLKRHPNRQFKGACRDNRGYIGPAVLSPPDVDAMPGDLDLDEAFALWDVDRDAYEREKYPGKLQKPAVAEISAPAPLAGRKVAVGDRQMNVVEQGEGGIPVVLESGLGDDHQIWDSVQRAVSSFNRVISYDRAGLGRSDAGSESRSPEQIARELQATLDAADIAPPYVLVAHAEGALSVRSFAALFPEHVAGLVLVDPVHAEQAARWHALDKEGWTDYLERKQAFYAGISDVVASEFQAFRHALEDGQAADWDLPEVPLVVLSADRDVEQPAWVGETPEGRKARLALHQSLAEQANGSFIVTRTSSSYIHLDKPDIVVDAIRQVLRDIEK